MCCLFRYYYVISPERLNHSLGLSSLQTYIRGGAGIAENDPTRGGRRKHGEGAMQREREAVTCRPGQATLLLC